MRKRILLLVILCLALAAGVMLNVLFSRNRFVTVFFISTSLAAAALSMAALGGVWGRARTRRLYSLPFICFSIAAACSAAQSIEKQSHTADRGFLPIGVLALLSAVVLLTILQRRNRRS